jgi:hypothetical protein
MIPEGFRNFLVSDGGPAFVTPGMTILRFDPQGRLRYFRTVPPARDDIRENASPYEWKHLFDRAGLEMGRFSAIRPALTPPQAYDDSVAWWRTIRQRRYEWRGPLGGEGRFGSR